jgi:hypothetical protein
MPPSTDVFVALGRRSLPALSSGAVSCIPSPIASTWSASINTLLRRFNLHRQSSCADNSRQLAFLFLLSAGCQCASLHVYCGLGRVADGAVAFIQVHRFHGCCGHCYRMVGLLQDSFFVRFLMEVSTSIVSSGSRSTDNMAGIVLVGARDRAKFICAKEDLTNEVDPRWTDTCMTAQPLAGSDCHDEERRQALVHVFPNCTMTRATP